jgi:flagellar hook-basal body complex protein FliE
MAISPIGTLPPVNIAPPSRAAEANAAGGFGEMLQQSIARVEALRADAGEAVGRMLAGEGEELHSVAMATQKAELSFEMFLQVRNKVVQAYQEIMRMQL